MPPFNASDLRKVVYKTIEDSFTFGAGIRQAKVVEFASANFGVEVYLEIGAVDPYKYTLSIDSSGKYSVDQIGFPGANAHEFLVSGPALYIKSSADLGKVTARKEIKYGEIASANLVDDSANIRTGWKAVDGTYTTQLESLTVDGNFDLRSDLDVNGGDITTTQTTFNLINTNATTLNIGGAATTLNLAAANGVVNINSTVNSNGSGSGALVVDGGIGVANNAYFGSNANVAGTLSVTGNAGFGQAAGTEKLEVTGNSKISGDLAVNGGNITTSSQNLNINHSGYSGTNPGIYIGSIGTTVTIRGDLAVNGGDITTSSQSLNIVNSGYAGEGTPEINIGDSSATVSIPGDLVVQGDTTYSGTATYDNILVQSELTSAFFPFQIKDTNPVQTVFSVGYNGSTYVGGDLQVGGTSTLAAVTGTTGSFSGNVVATNVYVGSAVTGYTGSFTNNLNVGEVLTVNSTTDSSSKDTGAVIVEGGVGIEKRLYVGSSASVGGNLSVSGDTNLTGDIAVNGGDISTSSQTLNIGYTGSLFSTTNVANAAGYIGSKTINIGTAAGNRTDVNIGYSGSGTTTIYSPNTVISGNLVVDGTTTTINSTTVVVDDKVLELGKVDTPSDDTADGSGIQVAKQTGFASLLWDKTNGWEADGSKIITAANIAANETELSRGADSTGNSGSTSDQYVTAVSISDHQITLTTNTFPTFNQDTTGNAGSADKVKTAGSETNESFYPVFADSNNGSATNESLYTASGLTINPSTGRLSSTQVYSGGHEVLTTNDIGGVKSITLDTVTNNGATTTNSITVGALTVSGGNAYVGSTVFGYNGSFGNNLRVFGTSTLAAVTGTTGSFSGAVTGANGSFSSGAVSSFNSYVGSTVFGYNGSFSNDLRVFGNSTLAGVTGTTGSFSGAMSVGGTTTLVGSVSASGRFFINSTSSSTSNTSGALVVAGGVGISGNVYIGSQGIVNIANTSNSSTTVGSNALVISNGGLGVKGNIYTEGNLYFSSDERLKTKISEISNSEALDLVSRVDIWEYIYNFDQSEKRHIGVMAQDIERGSRDQISSLLVDIGRDDSAGLDDKRTLKETKLVYILWAALKEESEKRKELERQIREMRGNLGE